MTLLSPSNNLPKPLQSEINLLRNIVRETLSGYSNDSSLSDKIAVANIIHFSVAAYNRLVSALYYPSQPPQQHLYDWATIRRKMDSLETDLLSVGQPEPIFPLEPYTRMVNADDSDGFEAIF